MLDDDKVWLAEIKLFPSQVPLSHTCSTDFFASPTIFFGNCGIKNMYFTPWILPPTPTQTPSPKIDPMHMYDLSSSTRRAADQSNWLKIACVPTLY
jgi:hypothetical protein